jgi:hypothetical protein
VAGALSPGCCSSWCRPFAGQQGLGGSLARLMLTATRRVQECLIGCPCLLWPHTALVLVSCFPSVASLCSGRRRCGRCRRTHEHRFGLLDISTVSVRACDAGTIMTHAALTSVARAQDSTVLWLCRAVSGATMTAVMPACPRAWWEGRCGLHMAGGGVSVWVWAGCLCVFV